MFPWNTGLAQADDIYHRKVDHNFAKVDGHKLYMDIFTPTGKAPKQFKPGDQGKGLGIVQVVSGSWHSDRSRFRPHERAQVYNLLCARGYTVFALRPGDRKDFTLQEMLTHVQMGIRYLKVHAAHWDIDPKRLGIMGGSAGGHLAALAALGPGAAVSDTENPFLQQDSSVQAAAVFFPPTDFLELEAGDFLDQLPKYQGLFFEEGEKPGNLAAITARAKALSPLYQVHEDAPPFFVVHGDADPVVPVSQSRKFVAALQDAGCDVVYHEIQGVGHNWPTMPVQVMEMVDWFDEQLAGVPLKD